jgi:hypothetical protein
MKFDFHKNLARGLSIVIIVLSSASTLIYPVDVIAAGAGKDGGNSGNSGNSDGNAGDARDSKGENASDTGKAARAARDDAYEKWLLGLLKE